MKQKIISVIFLFFLVAFLASLQRAHVVKNWTVANNSSTDPQTYPVKKPRYDYMSTFLSRNTKPLGLKEDLEAKKLMRQPAIKWAFRAGNRHILD